MVKRTTRKRGSRKKKARGTYGLSTLLSKITKKVAKEILGGTLLAIDPSCGSASSQPGYAIYREGVLTESGILEIESISRDVGYRLRDLRSMLSDLSEENHIDVLVVEHIPARRYGGGGAAGHASLLNAEGVCLASVDAPRILRVRPQTWHSMKPEGWEKTDTWDAIAIGHCVIKIAREKLA